jgi:hypothetical protein
MILAPVVLHYIKVEACRNKLAEAARTAPAEEEAVPLIATPSRTP